MTAEVFRRTATNGSGTRSRFLGETTRGLRVNVKLQIAPLPTGAYHLMDPKTDPLLTVEVESVSRDIRRVCVKARLEGLSATAVRTIQIEPRRTAAFPLQTTLFPERAQAITEVQRASVAPTKIPYYVMLVGDPAVRVRVEQLN